MATQTVQTTAGQPRELARYDADVGERRIVAQRVDNIVQLRDEPSEGNGRSYLIEPRVDSMAELDAIVDDYVAKADRLGWVPMHGW